MSVHAWKVSVNIDFWQSQYYYSTLDNPLLLRVTLEIVVWIFDTFGNNLEIKIYFAKYLKKSWLLYTN